jgi:hypothetical protein
VTALGQVLIATSVLACGIIYGTDVFSAIVLRPALALVDDRTLVSIMGRVHDFGTGGCACQASPGSSPPYWEL